MKAKVLSQGTAYGPNLTNLISKFQKFKEPRKPKDPSKRSPAVRGFDGQKKV